MAPAPLTPYQVRAALKAAGFSPIPTIGKRPLLRGWPELFDVPLDVMRDDYYWRLYRNTGILTAYAPAFDIDILYADAADAVEDLVRAWFDGRGIIPVKFGLWPKRTLLFRTGRPFDKFTISLIDPGGHKHKIEVLGRSAQTIVHGIHPDTRQPYRWVGPELWTLRCNDLVAADEREMHALAKAAAGLLMQDFGFRLDQGAHSAARPGCNGARRRWDWKEVEQGVDDGDRNDAAKAYIGLLFRKYDDDAVVLDKALGWNARNRPPLGARAIGSWVRSIGKIHRAHRQAGTAP
jgi:hypothetical protein